MAYHLYEELSKEKGFSKDFADDFLSECVDIYQRLNITEKSLSKLIDWTKDVTSENQYKDIDSVMNKNTFVIENIVTSRQNIINTLISKKEIQSESINIPLEKMVEVANSTIKNYLESLNESDLEQIKKYSTLSEGEVSNRYEVLSELVIEKLEKLSKNSDSETKVKIDETILKIKNDTIDSVSLLKLKNLNESL
jgi:rubrerythrin